MHHLNPYRFYELAAKIHGLFHGTTQHRVADMFGPLTEAQAALDSLIKGDPFPLETSKADAVKLLSKISNVFNRYFIDQATKQIRTPEGEDRIDQHEIASIQSLVEKFEHALAAELNRSPTYTADKRGIYSTYDLIENASYAFSPHLQNTIASAVKTEFDLAGRALAFGLGTAAAVHLLRSIEIMLKQYYELFSGSAAAKGERNYALYLKKLSAMAEDEANPNRPDKRVIQMLAQIKDHYRNPLTAPENTVSIEQATSLFGLSSAIISLMAEQILTRQQSLSNKDMKSAITGVSSEEDDSYDFRLSQAG